MKQALMNGYFIIMRGSGKSAFRNCLLRFHGDNDPFEVGSRNLLKTFF